MDNREPRPPIRSYVRREGRITRAQHRALQELLPVYGLDPEQGIWDLDRAFGRRAPRLLEIGFGAGETLLQMAAAHPERDYIGIEVHQPGAGALLLGLHEHGLTNVRVACADAALVLQDAVPDEALDGVYLFFPDPWPKKRHHKRRLVQPRFAELIRRKLKPGGCLRMATDWQDYAEHMMAVMSMAPGFVNAAGARRFAGRGDRPLTKYERRGQRLGHDVWDLVFTRIP
ncbi:MAG: tRNA (guanosine(46)-N7)-methyltransferase TrmB [Gammaproteobacteria bacterium]|nr:tRNA (guanosine(46)-N7)-methyltransferase TrmB [Gammaproteobacteria bacterium]NIR99258.1 tRNA (guanosine(46)-N7)-methyltransferase TrmB [Gammaproteobacteria bacterium]NIT64879.1 tRNA (guanosine(46)-N7)-methyltransferase TrmB [Gammaproteobacteria bacterium]NIV21829.1 tRNA (guanosine(46)-N7)-methyltransferase TrmB [Gammaproteobacteria bacterium]NIX10898.1 tRNA (guanosine(46)-N7)-methyltransferase TrmB [Gammaproteobacteria bacterium]